MGTESGNPFPIPIVQRWKASPLIAADCGGFEDQEDRVDEDAHNGGEDDGGNAVREQERNVEGEDAVGECEVTTDTTDKDDRADCELLRVEEVDLLRLDERDALHTDHAEEVDAQAADNCGGHGVDQRNKFAEEAQHDRHATRSHEDGGGVVACDRHERVVLTVVRACASAEQADDDII